MSSVPEGRAANHPVAADTFTPPSGAWFPGASLMMLVTSSPASSVHCTSCAERAASRFFCAAVAGASTLSYAGSPNSRVRSA